jgi:type VI secretion system protein ImpK
MSDALYWPCSDALILASQLAVAGNLAPPTELRQRITDVLDRMVGSARAAQVPEADIAEARYALVAFIDEQLLKSTWPGRAEWMNQPLQMIFYREFAAGETFFTRMRALLNQGNRESALQIYYLCLALGFRGAFGTSGDAAGLASFTEAAKQQVVRHLPAASRISPHAQPRDRASAEKRGRGAILGMLGACVVVALATIVTLQLSLHSKVNEALLGMPGRPASSAR